MREEVEGPFPGRKRGAGEVGEERHAGAGEVIPERELALAEAAGGKDVPGIPAPPGSGVVNDGEVKAMAGREQVAELEQEEQEQGQGKAGSVPAAGHGCYLKSWLGSSQATQDQASLTAVQALFKKKKNHLPQGEGGARRSSSVLFKGSGRGSIQLTPCAGCRG